MLDLRISKIKVLHTKKQMLILVTLIAINTLLFTVSSKIQDSPMLHIRNKNNERLIKNLQYSSLVSISSDTFKDDNNMKYILQWFPGYYTITEKEGQITFIKAKCKYTNCFVTSHRDYLGHYLKFDAIVLGPLTLKMSNSELPQIRSPHQKYIFYSMESSANFPVCSDKFDGYFNWTWTFRLDSDSYFGHLVVRDINGTIVGPKPDMHWMKLADMDAVPKDVVQERLKTKTKIAAWLVSNCYSKNKRENFVSDLNKELKIYGSHYQVDIYGKCGDKKCSNRKKLFCQEMIEQIYYFYLAFENSNNPDYVTEKLLAALQYYTVPVVYGGANYSRFMPDGIYLNARELGVKKLAAKMVEIMNDFNEYISFFKWKKHYTYTTTCVQTDSNDYCKFCALLNNESEMRKITVKRNFQNWWDAPNAQDFCY